MYAVAPLTEQSAPIFLDIVTPFYHSLIEDLDENVVAFGASYNQTRIGVAIAQLKPKLCHAELLHLYVHPEHRRKGNASTILKRMETELVDRGIPELIASVNPQNQDLEAIQGLLAKHAWQPLQPANLVMQSDLDHLAEASWLQTDLEPGFEVFDWKDLTEAEAEELAESQATENWIPPDLYPLSQSDDLHLPTSLGLRYQGKVVGWVLTFRWDERSLYMRASYIHPRFQRTGQILPMYREVARRMKELDLYYALWVVPLRHETMVKFARRRMAPNATAMVETWGTKKALESW